MLFASHSHRQEQVSAKDLTWQEVIYKCRVKLQRVPLFYDDEEGPNHMRAQSKIEEYCYELCLIEDLEDGRVHDVDEANGPPGSYEDVSKAGLRARVPIHQISKLFYTNSGTLLGIEDSSSPILLIKRDVNAGASRRLAERYQKYQHQFEDNDDNEEPGYALDMGEGKSLWDQEDENQVLPEEYDLPRHLDPEWLAFEVFTETLGEEDDLEADDSSQYGSQDELPVTPVSSPELLVEANSLATAHMEVGADKDSSRAYNSKNVKSSLSTLECLLRLTILQNYQQTSHLAVHDELLNLFLSDSAWSGSRESRQLERENARKRIGFDPFGSPTKKQLSPKTTKEGTKIGSRRDIGTPAAKSVNSLHRGGTPQRLPNTPHLDPGSPITPSSNRRPKGLSASNIPSPAPVLWTPEQQLSSMFENTYISSSTGRNTRRHTETPEDPSNRNSRATDFEAKEYH